MWPFGKRTPFNEELFSQSHTMTEKICDRLDIFASPWTAYSVHKISDIERDALTFVAHGADTAMSKFLMENGAPFKKIRESDIPSGNVMPDAYLSLLKTFFLILEGAIRNDDWLSSRLTSGADRLKSKFSVISGYPSELLYWDMSKKIQTENGSVALSDLLKSYSENARDHTMDVCLADFRYTLCGSIEGLNRWKPPGEVSKSASLTTTTFSEVLQGGIEFDKVMQVFFSARPF